MVDCNEFEPLRELHPEVLAEIIREGEDRLKGQLQVATAADARALAIAGSQITAATAALGGGIALARGDKPDLWLAFLALFFACALLVAAYHAIQSNRPEKFSFPGNRPKFWLPERWMGASGKDFSIKQARIEQAFCIDEGIEHNQVTMDAAARKVHWSMDLTLITTAAAAILLLGTFVARNWTIAEPTSEIVQTA